MNHLTIGPTGAMRVRDKMQFMLVPEGTRNVRHLGSLIFDKRQDLGEDALIDLTDTELPLLARDLVAAMYEHARPGSISSDLTVGAYASAMRDILSYCRARGVSVDFRMSDLSFDFLLDYRAHLGVEYAEKKNDVRRRRFGNVLRLIEAGKALRLASPDFQLPRNFSYVNDENRTQPYPPGELLDLEDACRTHILELTARLERGRDLLARGVNPRAKPKRNSLGQVIRIAPEDRGWNQLPNLLWYVVNILDGRSLSRSELLEQKHFSFVNSITGVFGGRIRKNDVYSHLYPLIDDLIPFVILLAKTTGRNESSILGLRRDCLEEGAGRYYLLYKKDRGSARSYRKAIPNDGPFSPVQLIRLLLKLTEPLVRFAPEEDKALLLLGLSLKTHNTEPVKRIDASLFKVQMNNQRENGSSWCTTWGLTTTAGAPLTISMRRLRVNYLTSRYLKTGQLSKVSRDAAHTLSRTTIPYVDNSSTKTIHEESVERAIKNARAVAISSTIQSSEHLPSNDSSFSVQNVKRTSPAEQDVFFASCRDFYNRPGGLPNTPCDQPWGCFFCSNAVITSHVLPRVIKFRDFMECQRQKLHPRDWNEKFGKVWDVLTIEVLPRFTSEVITHAESLAADEILYIPIHLKGE